MEAMAPAALEQVAEVESARPCHLACAEAVGLGLADAALAEEGVTVPETAAGRRHAPRVALPRRGARKCEEQTC